MDDETGWNEILVDGWNARVRAAVVERVGEAFIGRRGELVIGLVEPEAAESAWTQAVHDELVVAIRVETGADMEELGSHAAWAVYDDAWSALARRWREAPGLAEVRPERERSVAALIADLPAIAIRRAGGLAEWAAPLRVGGSVRVDVEGLFRWLATDEAASDVERDRVQALIAVVRGE